MRKPKRKILRKLLAYYQAYYKAVADKFCRKVIFFNFSKITPKKEKNDEKAEKSVSCGSSEIYSRSFLN